MGEETSWLRVNILSIALPREDELCCLPWQTSVGYLRDGHCISACVFLCLVAYQDVWDGQKAKYVEEPSKALGEGPRGWASPDFPATVSHQGKRQFVSWRLPPTGEVFIKFLPNVPNHKRYHYRFYSNEISIQFFSSLGIQFLFLSLTFSLALDWHSCFPASLSS